MSEKSGDKENRIWDVIVVGAGPAGSSAAMVLARSRRSVLLIDDEKPRNERSQGMHNYLSRDGTLPVDFLQLAHGELAGYGITHIKARATGAKFLGKHGFQITDRNGDRYLCRRLLIATGVKDNIPDVPGMQELWGRGVYHCPFCDGYELCDKKIGLYARHNNGYGMALALRHLTHEVILFTDGARYLKSTQRQHLAARNIRIISSPIAELTRSGDTLTCVTMRNGEFVPCDAVFTNNGHQVNNDLLLQLGARMTSKGAAVTSRKQSCSVPGVYVAGDAAIDMHFVVVAAAEGAKAAVAIHDDLLKTDNFLHQESIH